MQDKNQSAFTVVVDGMALPEEAVARINDALQRAALTEIASLDLRGNELIFQPIMAGMAADRGEEGMAGGGPIGGARIQISALRQL
jgi:hypothetical protein